MKKTENKKSFLSKDDLMLLRRAFGYLKPHIVFFILTFASIVLGMVFELFQPLLYGRIIDYILDKKMDLIWQTIIFLFGLTLANGGISLLETYLSDLLGNRIILDLKRDLYDHLLNLPIKVYDELRVGEIISRLEGDVGTLSNIITFQSMRIILDIVKVFGIGFIIFRINMTLAWIIVCAFPLSYLVMGWFGRILRRKGKKMRKLNDNYYSFLAESFSGVREVKALHIEELIKGKFIDWTRKIFSLQINMDVIGALSGLSTMWLSSFTSLIVMGIGGYLIIGGSLTMGMYVSFNRFSGMFNGSLGNIAGLNASIQQAMVSLERIFALIDNFMLPPEKREGLVPEKTIGEIKIDHVTFSYETEIPVLQDISFSIPANQLTALVGASGGGKTTLLNLLLRFYEPMEGKILLDDYSLSQLNLDYLRGQIGIVPQEPFLFNMSIKENLLLVQPEATMEEIIRATEKAYIHHFITSLPDGYETVVGERGTRLSGGQKQRLAIARAILKGSKILLLDEPTSALDGEAEEYIHKMIQELLSNHTIIVIAHRLSTVINAQQIVVLSDGQIHGIGTHQNLIQSNKAYQRLYQSQWNTFCTEHLLEDQTNKIGVSI
ncbi:MAG: ABC transporter ATP-binding protein [Halanaerobiales bacterium]|nr:ABC transporter ATP-binding protein [Halanaerobiales bacterium]